MSSLKGRDGPAGAEALLQAPTHTDAPGHVVSRRPAQRARARAPRQAARAVDRRAPHAVDAGGNTSGNITNKCRRGSAQTTALGVARHGFGGKNVFKDEVQVTIGPWIENGYYYDFHKPTGEAITDKDLKRIKKEMDKIIKKDYPIIREVLPREEARQFLLDQGETFKVEVVDNLPDEAEISFYRIGDEWWDLCAGPHLESLPGKISESRSLEICRRRLLARRREPRDAHAHLRHGLARGLAVEGTQKTHGGSEETRPSVTREEVRFVQYPRASRRWPLFLAPARRARAGPDGTDVEGLARERRL